MHPNQVELQLPKVIASPSQCTAEISLADQTETYYVGETLIDYSLPGAFPLSALCGQPQPLTASRLVNPLDQTGHDNRDCWREKVIPDSIAASYGWVKPCLQRGKMMIPRVGTGTTFRCFACEARLLYYVCNGNKIYTVGCW